MAALTVGNPISASNFGGNALDAGTSHCGYQLQRCIQLNSSAEGKAVHARIIKLGLEIEIFLGNCLVNMYAKCGNMKDARKMFDNMAEQNLVSWNMIIAGYAQQGLEEEALELFEEMQLAKMVPNEFTFGSVLKACASREALEEGKQVHCLIVKLGFEQNLFLGSALIDMYSKCGSIRDAYQTFAKISQRNVVSWNAIIAASIQHGWVKQALELFAEMQLAGIKASHVTFGLVLNASAILGNLEQGKQLHACVFRNGFGSDLLVGSSVILMYIKCGNIDDARQVFDKMPMVDLGLFNATIQGYSSEGHNNEAMELESRPARGLLFAQDIQQGAPTETPGGFLRPGVDAGRTPTLIDTLAVMGIDTLYPVIAENLDYTVDCESRRLLPIPLMRALGVTSGRKTAEPRQNNDTDLERSYASTTWIPSGQRNPSIVERGRSTEATYELGSETGNNTHMTLKNRGAKEMTQITYNPQKLTHMAAECDQDENRIQIFIKSTAEGHRCMRLRMGSTIQELKKEIQQQLGIPSNQQNLICAGRCLQDQLTIKEYGIRQDTTILLNLRLRGGSKGSGSKAPASFRDAVKGKEKMQNKPETLTELPGPYIVDQKLDSPSLQVTMPEVTALHSDLTKTAIICRFNGFWPKSDALHQWIYSNWTTECDIHLCSKGYFIVGFHTEEERDSIITDGPWFWGNAGLFVTPWFADFDANTMKITTMPVWVRLHNLPLHFWHHLALAAIGNTLGKFIKMDEDRLSRGIFSFARICIEVDMSQGLPEHITLNFNNSQRVQPLDYENTAFRCRGCRQTGHLLFDCPLVKKNPKGNKNRKKKPNGWQHTEPLEEEDIHSEQAVDQEESDTNMEQQATHKDNSPDPHPEPPLFQPQHNPQLDVGGIKRSHGSEGSESDKESPVNNLESTRALIISSPDTQGWRRVEKKKGRKD